MTDIVLDPAPVPEYHSEHLMALVSAPGVIESMLVQEYRSQKKRFLRRPSGFPHQNAVLRAGSVALSHADGEESLTTAQCLELGAAIERILSERSLARMKAAFFDSYNPMLSCNQFRVWRVIFRNIARASMQTRAA